jgi:hypothetical protein
MRAGTKVLLKVLAWARIWSCLKTERIQWWGRMG